jgi:hypothetical protein
MGGSQSHEQAQKTDESVQGGVYHALKYAGRIHGGTGEDIDTDNLSTLKNYENSVAGKTKENTIRKIARAMREVGINVNPDDEDLDKIIKDLNKEIPNPKKGKTFAANAKTQAKVCRSVAKVLNNEFGGTLGQNFIDMSGSPVEICRTVGEITHSLNQGVNTEFLGVIGSVKNSLHAINLMDQVMANMYAMMQKHIKSANNSYVDREIRPLHDIYTKAKNEKEQKKMVLENLLHIHLEPASEALKHALDEHSRDAALIKKIGLTPGSSSMSDAIASTLTGVGTSTTILNRAHKALKVVGKSMSDYINSHSFKEFEKHLGKIVEEGKMSPDQLEKFIEATEILKQGFKYRKQNVHGGTRQGGRRIKFSGQDEDNFGMPMQSSMRSRAQRVIGTKSIINKDFVVRLDNHYNELLQAIMALSKELGKSVPLTSKTELLKDALMHLQNHNGSSENEEATIEIVITHGINTVKAKEVKEQYINKLKMIANICDQIISMDAYKNVSSMFSKVKEIILKIEKIIEYYSSTIIKTNNSLSDIGTYDNTYSKSINNPQESDNNSTNNDSNDNDITVGGSKGGNYDKALDYEINTPLIAKTGLTLNEIINTFNYYYYLASVRNNLKIYSKEYDIFGEDYNNMLGNSIAKRLYELERDYTIDIKKFIKDISSNDYPKLKPQKDEIRKWIDNEYNIKIKFYKALQALDLYLKEFTPAITSNIDAVKEIKSMLDETQVIARWYNETTGNDLISAFEELPGLGFYDITNADKSKNGTAKYNDSPENNLYINNGSDSTHYYEQIHNKLVSETPIDNNIHFGNPLYSRDYENCKDNIKNMKKNVDGSIDHFQALKNIINTFIRIGNKFGNTDLSTKIFMSPSQIYKILFTYLKQSALKLYVPEKDNIPLYNKNDSRRKISPYNVYFTGCANQLGDNMGGGCLNNYEIEDKFFHLMIKAMAGKIMTVVGSYDMLEMAPPKHWITNTRIILGGGQKGGEGIENPVSFEDNLEIITGALPLYFKLPRLIEFYRELLGFNYKNNINIAFLPDLDGVFTQLFLLIFRRSANPENGDYSDSELHKIVEEINNIYNYYAKQNKSEDITTSVMQDIVIDINRKYGLIKKEEYDIWVKMTKQNTNLDRIRINNTNYSILPDENEFEVNTMAPSDIYKSIVNDSVKIVDYENDVKKDLLTGKEYTPFSSETPDIHIEGQMPQLELLRAFRSRLDDFFTDSKIKNMTSYTILVHQAEDAIKRAKTNKEKISTVFQLIQGTGNLGIKNDKQLLFHETIVSGLNVLGAIYVLISDYNKKISNMNPFELEKECMDSLYRRIIELNFHNVDYTPDDQSAYKKGIIAISNHGGLAGDMLKYYTNIRAGTTSDFYYTNDKVITAEKKKYLIGDEYAKEPVFRGSPIFAHIEKYQERPEYIVNDKDNLYDKSRERQPIIAHANQESELFRYKNEGKAIDQNTLSDSIYHLSYNVLTSFRAPVIGHHVAGDNLFLFSKLDSEDDNEYIMPSKLINKDNLDLNNNFNYKLLDGSPIDIQDAKTLILYLRTVARISVNYQLIMHDLLENIFSLVVDSNGLIDLTFIKIENNKIKLNLNFVKLQNLINGIITDIKYYIEYFRPFIKKDIINKYEKSTNPGSIYYMEEQFNNLFDTKLDMYNSDSINSDVITIDNITKKTENVFSDLTRDTLISFYNLSNIQFSTHDEDRSLIYYLEENMNNTLNNKNDISDIINVDNQFNLRYEWYGNTLSNLIFYDFSKKLPYKFDSAYALKDSIPINGPIHAADHNLAEFLFNDQFISNKISSRGLSLYLYNAISLYNEDTDFNNQDEYIQWSAIRGNMDETINQCRDYADGLGLDLNDMNFEIEDLDSFSYPKYKSSITGNYSYNMGIYENKIEEPIFPSNDADYKLSILIAKSPKDKDGKQRHLIQFENASIEHNNKEYSRLPLYNNNGVYNDHNSLMFIFNQILSRYVSAFIDPSTGNKIYKNLLNSFVNGIASKITSSPNLGFPDLIQSGTAYNNANINYISGHNADTNLNNSKKSMFYQKSLGLRGDIKEESIIFQSLAYILQRISKDIDPRNNINIHLLNTLTDVPLYMKESYKANLPSFIKIFDFIIQKSEFFKNIIQKTNINLSRYNQCDFANFINSCTGLTDVRVNEVRYELNTYQIMNKFYYGRSIYFIDVVNNCIISPVVSREGDDARTVSHITNLYNADHTQPIENIIPMLDSQVSNFDSIINNKITDSDSVKISCTRGTRGYGLILRNFQGGALINGYDSNTEFLKIKDSNAKKLNGFLSVEGLHKFTHKNEKTDVFKTKLISILDSIIAHSYTILSCADEVLKELGDNPVYFETFDGSIEHYKARNNNNQFMPLSLSFWFLNDNKSLKDIGNNGPTNTLIGGYSLGTNEFKMLYGIRQLFGRNSAITFDQIPGVKSLLNYHNSSSNDNQIEESKYLQFINRLVAGLRFVVNIHGYKSIVSYNSNSSVKLIGNADTVINPKNSVFALTNSPKKEAILQILEDSYQDTSIKKILVVLDLEKEANISRKDERIQVIIDSGINPINIHALMQDIPLANIYNYAYTFESMAAAMYEMPISNLSKDIMEIHKNKQTIYTFLNLIKNPFMHIDIDLFIDSPLALSNTLYDIFSGDPSLGMGRPKFLSDQLFNKCLLQNIAITPYGNKKGPQFVDFAMISKKGGSGEFEQIDNFLLRYSNYINNLIIQNPESKIAKQYNKFRNGYILNTILDENKDSLKKLSSDILKLFILHSLQSPPNDITDHINNSNSHLYKSINIKQMEPNIKKYYTQLLNDIHRKHIALENKMTQNYNMLDGDQIDAINRTASDEFKVSSFDKYKDSNVVIMSYLTDYNTNKSVSSSSLGDYNELKLFIYDNNNLPLLGSSKVPKQRIFSSVLKDAISHIGYYRFNTNIVRNMFFISNILRIIRLQINREFTQNRNILKSSHFAISPSITEYGTMNPNEAYNSNYRGEREFNDESGKFYDEV